MSFPNPTPIRVGMTGTFSGRVYHVAGRIVMGMEEAGETYHWNEFHLVGADGQTATLVFEEAEAGATWRMFTDLTPQQPMSVAEATAQRVGDTVNLDGAPKPVTLVDESRVLYIEGQAPEGVELDDVARYFNAEAGGQMIVVSWTGDEIEFYRGLDLPQRAVAAAFNLPNGAFRPTQPAREASPAKAGVGGKIGGAFVVLLIGAMALPVFKALRPCPAGPVKPALPAAPLSIGSTGRLDGVTYRVQGHAVVEIAEVGALFDRHEYQLADEGESPALLVYGWRPGAQSWLLLTPFEPARPLTPQQAAAQRGGQMLDLDGTPVPVKELFRAKIGRTQNAELSELNEGAVLYGFLARAGSNIFLARWRESGISFYRGQILSAKDVTAAFANNPVK
jgi:hypothetical protein